MSIKNFLINVLAFIFHFIPRNKHIWLTGKPSPWYNDFTPPKFFDNSKYFYLYLVNNTKEKVYWVSSSEEEIKLLKSEKLPVVRFKSLKGVYLTLRAKYFFHHYGINQIDSRLQYGAVHLNFWHGTPLKKIRYDVVPKEVLNRNRIVELLDKNSHEYVSSTSEYLSNEILCRAFDVSPEFMLNYGYPRTDILSMSREDTFDFCKKYSKELISYIELAKTFKKVFLYMPTWRDDDPQYFEKANIDFKTLNSELKNNNYVLFLKLHPLTKTTNIEQYSNIKQLNNDVDIYPFLNFTDCLVTDYSSIYFDYLLTDKEIIFIPYDYDNYIKNRALYFEYNDITPGIKYSTFNEFINDLNNFKNLDYSAERKQVRDLLIKDYNFDACERIYNNFKDR